jgi:hypothetical protein
MIISPDAKGKMDAPVYNILTEVSSPIPIIPITAFSDFIFDEKLYDLKEWVLADYMELGANDWDRKETLLWGVNSQKFNKAQSEEWVKFERFVQKRPPKVYFKRELLLKDMGGNVYPIDFAAFSKLEEVQTKEQFYARPISILNIWGHSHELRRATHGNFFLNSTNKGYGVVDNFYHFERAIKEYSNIWATICVPHYARLPMNEVFNVQGQSKLSISLPGAGCKCFRHSEASVNSVMVMEDAGLAWSYDWKDGVNCIMFPGGKDMEEIKGLKNSWRVIDAIETALENPNLYEIYLKGIENCRKYYLPEYAKNYIEPIIKKHL